MTRNRIIKISRYFIILLIFFNLACATIIPAEKEYYNIVKEIRTGSADFAFMKMRGFAREYPKSIYEPKVRFAIAEYYFQTRNYPDAINAIISYITDYPDDKSTIFAYAVLYKIISEHRGNPELLEKLKEKFFSKPLFLIFSEAKIKSYNSILNNKYKIAEYVEKVEIFKNNELFCAVTP
jgi:hypothetical protein